VDTVAVLDFKANNTSASDAVTITGFVRSAFIRAGVYRIVDKENMEKILAEQAFQQTGCTDQNCAVKLGKLLNVKKMVVGEYSVVSGVRFLTASLVDVETGVMERTGKVRGFEPGKVDDAAENLAAELMGTAATAPKVQGPVDPRVARGRIGIGLNSPGLGLRVLIGSRWLLEGRCQWDGWSDDQVLVGGLRFSRYVFPTGRIYPYLGLEGDYITFTKVADEEMGRDKGYAGAAVAGVEYFLWKRLSFQFDFGPAYVKLQNSGTVANGIRYVVNFGLTYYF
jgi:hypothetical protein